MAMENDEIGEGVGLGIGLIQEYGPPFESGLPLGSSINVPADSEALVVRNGEPLDVLPSGRHSVHPANLPLLVQKARLQPDHTGTVDARIYLIKTGRVEGVPWESLHVLSRNRKHGLMFISLKGQCSLRVTDSRQWFAAVFKAGMAVAKEHRTGVASAFPTLLPRAGQDKSFANSNIRQLADFFLIASIQSCVELTTQKLKLAPDQILTSQEELRSACQVSVAQQLPSIGVECDAFRLEEVSQPYRAPCARCGSETAKTAYGVFRRNISLFFVRFTASREGNLCVPCALKVAIGYNATMLVVGWWGYIGAILTPIYSVQNLYNLAGILIARKIPTRTF